MESISISTGRSRFRNHSQKMAGEDSAEGETSADSLSVSSDEDEEPEFQSMTAKGVQHLCSELLELKQESDEDFQKIIFSNYSAFLAILKERDCLQSEVLRLKYQATLQRRIIKNMGDGISLRILPEDALESAFEEALLDPPSSQSILATHTENISEILDTLLSEHRLDEAITLLEMEDEFVQSLSYSEEISSDQLTLYKSSISEKKTKLADQLILVASHPRVSAPELHKALLGLCQLGEKHLVTKLLFQCYHLRITSGISNFRSSDECPHLQHFEKEAKIIFSLISQASRSFVTLIGDSGSCAPELTQWASEQIETLAVCFTKYIQSISEINGRLLACVDAVQITMSYCSLLETQTMFLQPCLLERLCPRVEDALQLHIDHLTKVISMFTSTETWPLGRYCVSGILTGRSYAIADQQPEYVFLTNSGRKFVTLLQSIVEDISPLLAIHQIDSLILKGMMDLFVAYTTIIQSVFTGDTIVEDEGGSRINFHAFPTQGFFALANLSTLVDFFSATVRNISDSAHHLDIEIDHHMKFIQDIYHHLKAYFIAQFISNIFSPNTDHECGLEICNSSQGDPQISDMVPSLPYLELYLELKKQQKFAEDDCIDGNWLRSLLREVMDATFDWISTKSNIWTIDKESIAYHQTEFMQFILDAQFLVEIARSGGYLTDNVMHVSRDNVARIEAPFIAAGLNPPRSLIDKEWPANAATQALDKLQELQEKEFLGIENAITIGLESSMQYVSQADKEAPPKHEQDDSVTVIAPKSATDADKKSSMQYVSQPGKDVSPEPEKDDSVIENASKSDNYTGKMTPRPAKEVELQESNVEDTRRINEITEMKKDTAENQKDST